MSISFLRWFCTDLLYKVLPNQRVFKGRKGGDVWGLNGLYEFTLSHRFRTVYCSFIHSIRICFVKPEKKSLNLYGSYSVNKVIVISKGTELLRVPADRLVYVEADGNYSNVVTQDNKVAMVSFQLGQIEDLIGDQLGDAGGNFLRLGRGLIINQDFVYSIDVAKQRLILSDCIGCYHELSASREVLTKLKAYIDVMVKNG